MARLGRPYNLLRDNPNNVVIGRVFVRVHLDFDEYGDRILSIATDTSKSVLRKLRRSNPSAPHIFAVVAGSVEIAPGSISTWIELKLSPKVFFGAIAAIIGTSYAAIAQYPDFRDGLHQIGIDFGIISEDIGNQMRDECGADIDKPIFEMRDPDELYEIYRREARPRID